MSYDGFTLPKGFRFHPSDDELLSHYLQKKNQCVDSQITAIIPEIDVSKHEPRDLPAEDGRGSCSMAINIEYSASKQQENIIPFPYGDDEESQAFKELVDAVFGFDHSDGNDPLVCEDQPDSSDSLNSEMMEELLHKPGALAFPDTSPMTPLQSPIYTKQDTNNFLSDETRKRKYPFAGIDLLVTKKNHTDGVRSIPSSDSENQAANEISEGYQPGGYQPGFGWATAHPNFPKFIN